MENNSIEFIKIIIVGDSGVGKTSILSQYCFNKFDKDIAPTIGCDFTSKLVEINGNSLNIQIWDIAGQERYASVSKLYIRNALGCLIVCSSENEESVLSTKKWKKIIDENSDHVQGLSIPTFLVQNKSDLIGEKAKIFQQLQYLQQFKKENGYQDVFQVSAVNLNNIKDMFLKIIEQIVIFGEKNGLIKTKNTQETKTNSSGSKQSSNSKSQKLDTKKKKNGSQKGGCC